MQPWHPRSNRRRRRIFQRSSASSVAKWENFASHCSEKKKDKEASSSKVAVVDDGSGDDVAMSAHEPQRWGDMDM